MHIVLVAGQAVGAIAVGPAADGCAEPVYAMTEAHRCCGYSTEALRRVARRAMQQLQLQRLELRVAPANLASQRVAEKAGFQCEGMITSRVPAIGVAYQDLVYAWLGETSSN